MHTQGMEIAYLTPNAAASGKLAAGVVCPHCYRSLIDYNMYGPSRLPDQTLRRGYIGFCLVCRKACEVEQFFAHGVWPISGWRLDDGPWRTLQQPIPTDAEPAETQTVPPVLVGQGDGQRGYTPATDDALSTGLRQLHAILQRLCETVGEMIRLAPYNKDKDDAVR